MGSPGIPQVEGTPQKGSTWSGFVTPAAPDDHAFTVDANGTEIPGYQGGAGRIAQMMTTVPDQTNFSPLASHYRQNKKDTNVSIAMP